MMKSIASSLRDISSNDAAADNSQVSNGVVHHSHNLLAEVGLNGVYWNRDDCHSYLYSTPINLLESVREEKSYGFVRPGARFELTTAHRDVIRESLGINELKKVYSGPTNSNSTHRTKPKWPTTKMLYGRNSGLISLKLRPLRRWTPSYL